jgi:hypothetical protein
MQAHLHQEQSRQAYWIHKQEQDIISVLRQMHETRQLLYPMYINSLLEHGCQCPNVMKDTTNTNKPSKVLEIVARRDQQEI